MPRAVPDFDDLLGRSCAGDLDAQGKLLERYRPYLSLLSRVQIGRRLQGKLDASDVVQETFLEAHRHFEGFRGGNEEALLAWLRKILAGRIANLIRHYQTQRRNIQLERQLSLELDESSRALDRGLLAAGSSPSQQAARNEQAVRLANALSLLPEHYREVIILSQLESLSFPDVARRMGKSVDAVKNLWARALGRLRRNLGDAP